MPALVYFAQHGNLLLWWKPGDIRTLPYELSMKENPGKADNL